MSSNIASKSKFLDTPSGTEDSEEFLEKKKCCITQRKQKSYYM